MHMINVQCMRGIGPCRGTSTGDHANAGNAIWVQLKKGTTIVKEQGTDANADTKE